MFQDMPASEDDSGEAESSGQNSGSGDENEEEDGKIVAPRVDFLFNLHLKQFNTVEYPR